MTRRAGRIAAKPTLFDHIRNSRGIELDEAGEPDVTGLPRDLIECGDGKAYMRRYFVLGEDNLTGGSSARYHQILESDQAHMHDHPWDFVSVILSGSYVEATPDGEREYGPGSVLMRSAEQLHRLTLVNRQPVWTFVILGAPRRRWGFETEAGWVHWREYTKAPPSVSSALAVFDD